jgi:hypothetical protein
MKIESVNGREGCLIYCDGTYRIRFYTGVGVFKDYDIRHTDLWFEINDDDCFLYEDGDKAWIDHGPRS